MNTNRTHTFSVNGFELRTRTPRRYALVTTRATPVSVEGGQLIAFASVVRHSDNLQALQRAAAFYARTTDAKGCYQVVIDLQTGEAV